MGSRSAWVHFNDDQVLCIGDFVMRKIIVDNQRRRTYAMKWMSTVMLASCAFQG